MESAPTVSGASSSSGVDKFLRHLGIRSPDPMQELMQLTLQCLGALRVLMDEKAIVFSQQQQQTLSDLSRKESKTQTTSSSLKAFTTVPLNKVEEDYMITRELCSIFSVAIQLSLNAFLNVGTGEKSYYPAKDLIESFPNSRLLGTPIWLPLHWASQMNCKQTNLRTIVDKFPGFTKQRDRTNRTPMEYAVDFNNGSLACAITKNSTPIQQVDSDRDILSKKNVGENVCSIYPWPYELMHTLDPFTSREEEGQTGSILNCRNIPPYKESPDLFCSSDVCDADSVIDLHEDYMGKGKQYEMVPLLDEPARKRRPVNEIEPVTSKNQQTRQKAYFDQQQCGLERQGGELCDFRPDKIIEMFGAAYLPSLPCTTECDLDTATSERELTKVKDTPRITKDLGKSFFAVDFSFMSDRPCVNSDVNPLPPFSMCL